MQGRFALEASLAETQHQLLWSVSQSRRLHGRLVFAHIKLASLLRTPDGNRRAVGASSEKSAQAPRSTLKAPPCPSKPNSSLGTAGVIASKQDCRSGGSVLSLHPGHRPRPPRSSQRPRMRLGSAVTAGFREGGCCCGSSQSHAGVERLAWGPTTAHAHSPGEPGCSKAVAAHLATHG